MNVQDFTYLLQNPDKVVSAKQTKELEDVLSEYPYFQAARAIHLKGLKNLNSFKYNNALKITAAYTTDRNILFDFITSKYFLQNSIADTISGKTETLIASKIKLEKVSSEIKKEAPFIKKSVDEPLPKKDAEQILTPIKELKIDTNIKTKKNAEATLEIGKPLSFNHTEKFSFSEWLKLTSQKPITRDTPNESQKNSVETTKLEQEKIARNKKFERIDTFIANNPKIIPKETTTKTDVKVFTKLDKNELMTETLAKVYLEQKKYKKALQAYKILSLKYPKKSSFFAARIKAIEKVQQENTK